MRTISSITKEEFLQMLALSSRGFQSLVSRKYVELVNDMSFSEAIDYVLKNKKVIKNHLLFDGKVLVSNNHNINCNAFYPRRYKQLRSRHNTTMSLVYTPYEESIKQQKGVAYGVS